MNSFMLSFSRFLKVLILLLLMFKYTIPQSCLGMMIVFKYVEDFNMICVCMEKKNPNINFNALRRRDVTKTLNIQILQVIRRG